MTGVDDVLSWRLDDLREVATRLETLSDRLVDAAGRSLRACGADPEWSGSTHDAALTQTLVVGSSLGRSAHAIDTAADAVRSRTSVLADIQTTLRERVELARSQGYTVAADGTVTHPDPAKRTDARYLAGRIRALLTEADMADRLLHDIVTDAVGHLDGSGDRVTLPDGTTQTPAEAADRLRSLPTILRRSYWESLSQHEKDRVITASSAVVGNLDGIPFDDRVAANRYTMLMRADTTSDPDERERLESMLDDRRAFLAYEPDAGGRFVEIVGDLNASSTGVAVFVPGTGTAGDDADALRRRAVALNEKTGSPVIVWADSEFPQSIVAAPWKAPLKTTAVDPRLAVEAAPRLKQFVDALDTELAVAAPRAATTLIGHSYGGTIVGTAEQLGVRADRVVYASAAGTGALPGEWHNAAPDVIRYSITPPGDVIHYAQEAGTPLHGGDPDDADGVIRLDSGYLSPDEHGHRRLLEGRDSHSAYLDDTDSDAFNAIASVIRGDDPDRYVERVPDMHEIDDANKTLHDSVGLYAEFTGRVILDSLIAPFAPFVR
ncbi:alpha/beta hydrolase [Gordonia humi]|uniref:DUF1023 domain-containing protein n=1 Tax=Gordonia humi TaxID=686429 RepID=A0A840F1S5_9ACTN|nr:alpha/beta hydrolase [Gordonia humi]MBB4135329.1 hypothetical protein [Gordonia humi]